MKSHLFDSHNSAFVYIKFSISYAWNLSGNNDGRGSDCSLALWSYINTLMPENGRQCADNAIKHIFLNENIWV